MVMDLRSLTDLFKEELLESGPVKRPKPEALVQACDGNSALALLVAVAFVKAETELRLEKLRRRQLVHA